jgi:hypothetical protein
VDSPEAPLRWPGTPGRQNPHGLFNHGELGANKARCTEKNIWKADILTIQAHSPLLFADPEVFR